MAKQFTDADLARFRNKNGENIPVPKERKKPSHEESTMQCNLIVWWRAACRGFGIPETLLFAVGNGHRRDVVAAAILKREGLRPGVSDLILAVPRRGIPGMYLELKVPGGVLSVDQKSFISAVSAQGYDARVCYSFDEAVATITNYLSVK